MEVLRSSPPIDFNFDSACSSPRSSPKGFTSDYYFSAPTSPTRASSIYESFNDFYTDDSTSKNNNTHDHHDGENEEEGEEDDFAFSFSGELGRTSLTADELFDGGKIRSVQRDSRTKEFRTRKPRSPVHQGNIILPKRDGRGRERVVSGFSSSSSRRATRSLSPYRNTEFALEERQETSKPNPSSGKSSSRKWSLKDLLLFRSASEGRPLRKYNIFPRKNDHGLRLNEGSNSGARKKGQVSAHERHYTSNRAMADERKKKTFLPYKQGLFGWMGFTPTTYGPARGFTRG